MDEPTRQFLADAAHVRLTPDEKARFRDDLSQFVMGEVSMEELEQDPLVKSFLQEAAGISLTTNETEVARQDLTHFINEQIVRYQVEERHAKHMEDRSDILGDPDKIALSKRERSDVRRGLISFMEQKRAQERALLPEERLTLREYMHDFWRVVVPRTAVLACAFLIISTGAAFAAEGSVPGDWLYPLKVEVFEHVRGRFIFTPEERAQWEAARAMRRLEEAVWLAAHDDLTEANWLDLHSNFVEHVVQAERHIDMLARRGDSSTAEHLSADLDAYLRAHRTVLQSIALGRNDREIETAIEHVGDAQQDVNRRRSERFGAGERGVSEKGHESAEAGIQSAIAELNRAKRDKGLSDSSHASERLKEAEELLSEANAQFDDGSYKEAESMAREAVKKAAEAKLLRKIPHKESVVHEDWSEKNDTTGDRAKSEEKNNAVIKGEDSGSTLSDSTNVDVSNNSSEKNDGSYSSFDDDEEKSVSPKKGDDTANIKVVAPVVEVKVDLDGLLP